MADSLSQLAALVLPHLVNDAPLAEADAQRFLLCRTTSAIEDWLARLAAGIRGSLRLGTGRRRPDGSLAVGLRSATHEELVALPGIGEKRARELARLLALQPDIQSLEALDAVEGIGPRTLERLAEQAYLDEPWLTLASATLLTFATRATIESFLALLDESGLEVAFGDGTTLARRPSAGGTPVARFLRLLAQVRDEAEQKLSPAAGALASDAVAFLARRDLRSRYLADACPVDGALLVSGDYVQAVQERLAQAKNEIRMMMFVATATDGDADGPGPLAVVAAVEARAAAGVKVRVILDRDEPSAPYESEVINRPLVKRLRDKGIAVKLDTPSVLLHSKFFVVDEAAVVVGSHNLTRSSMHEIHEVSVLLEAPALARAFAQRFDALWTSLP